jgi:arylsulfatase A-like enzyme
VLPTMAELVGQSIPAQTDGLSMLPTLRGNSAAQRQHDFLYWEFTKGADQQIFSQAVRQGDWKAYLENGKTMELYRLDQDPYEQHDLAEQEPDRVREMHRLIAQAHTPL